MPKYSRVHFAIRTDQKQAIERLLPWGQRSAVVRALLDDLIAALEIDPGKVVQNVVNRRIRLEHISDIAGQDETG